VQVSLLYVDDCPNRQVAEARLIEALLLVGRPDLDVERVLITTDEEAQALRFRGSPTILIDGEDPFVGGVLPRFGLTCRVYRTDDGLAGSPTVDALVAELLART
jgi:hypothetical protein